MKKHTFFTALIAAFMTISAISIYAVTGHAAWQHNATGWWYQNPDGTWPKNAWQWIDGNGDGIYECYAFNAQGYMYQNTTTPDGFTVDSNGAWLTNGLPATRAFLGGIAPAPTPISTFIAGSQMSSGSSSGSSTKKTSSGSSGGSSVATNRDELTDSDVVHNKVSNKTTSDAENTSQKASSDESPKTTTTEPDPDPSKASQSSFGPSAGTGSSKNIGPSADLRDHGSPTSNAVVVDER